MSMWCPMYALTCLRVVNFMRSHNFVSGLCYVTFMRFRVFELSVQCGVTSMRCQVYVVSHQCVFMSLRYNVDAMSRLYGVKSMWYQVNAVRRHYGVMSMRCHVYVLLSLAVPRLCGFRSLLYQVLCSFRSM